MKLAQTGCATKTSKESIVEERVGPVAEMGELTPGSSVTTGVSTQARRTRAWQAVYVPRAQMAFKTKESRESIVRVPVSRPRALRYAQTAS